MAEDKLFNLKFIIMKKILTVVVIAVMSLTASAQIYVGGELNAWRDYEGNRTDVSILPEIGYTLSDNLAIGTVIGWRYSYTAGQKWNGLEVAPYLRYTFLKADKVNVFVDGGFGFKTGKVKGQDAANAWSVGLKPGVAVNLTDKLSFVTHFGFLGWRKSDVGARQVFGQDGFGLDMNGNNLTFGLYYNF